MLRKLPTLTRRHALGAILGTLGLTALAPKSRAAAPRAVSPPCGPQLQITVPYAVGLTGSPRTHRHTHAFSVTLVSGLLQDGQTVTVVGATSGVLQAFPQHTHPINSTGVLGASCGFVTQTGQHPFTLQASDFIAPS